MNRAGPGTCLGPNYHEDIIPQVLSIHQETTHESLNLRFINPQALIEIMSSASSDERQLGDKNARNSKNAIG